MVHTDAAAAEAAGNHGSHGAELEALREQLRTALGRAAASSTAARKASSSGATVPGSAHYASIDSHLGTTVDASTEAI